MENQAYFTDSHTLSVTEMAKGSHRYTIKGYSLLKGLGPGKYISSDFFTAGGYDWALLFYPDGFDKEDNSMYVSASISLRTDATDVKLFFSITLLDLSGSENHKIISDFDLPLGSGPRILKGKGQSWGYNRFIKRSELESSGYLKDDCIEFLCEVGVVMATRNEQPKEVLAVNVPAANLGHCFKRVLESGINSDIDFEEGDETFKAHKLIIAARSPVFQAQLFGSIGNPNIDKVVLKEITPSVFKVMLHFIYADSLPDLNELEGQTSSCLSNLFVQQLLAAADRFMLDRLKLMCEEKLMKGLTIGTVAFDLALAEQHNCSQLKTLCLKFAASPKNLKGVMQSEGYTYLKDSFPSLMLELVEAIAKNGCF